MRMEENWAQKKLFRGHLVECTTTNSEQHHHGDPISRAPLHGTLRHHLTQAVEGKMNGVYRQECNQVAGVCGGHHYGEKPEASHENATRLRPRKPVAT